MTLVENMRRFLFYFVLFFKKTEKSAIANKVPKYIFRNQMTLNQEGRNFVPGIIFLLESVTLLLC